MRRAHAKAIERLCREGITRSLPDFDSEGGVVDLTREEVWNKDRSELEVSFSSETPVQDYSWLPPVVLLHERGSMNRRRLHSALFNHNPDRIVGPVKKSRCDTQSSARCGRAVVRFDQDDDAQMVRSKVLSGSLRGVSVGFVVDRNSVVRIEKDNTWKSPEGREFQGPLLVVKKWAPIEFSFTPTPKDPTVGPGRQEQPGEPAMPPLSAQERAALIAQGAPEGASDEELRAFAVELAMRQQTATATPPATPPAPPAAPAVPPPAAPEVDAARIAAAREREIEEARTAERGRIAELRQIAANAGDAVSEELLNRWISDGVDPGTAARAALQQRAATETPVGEGPNVELIGTGRREQTREAFERGLLLSWSRTTGTGLGAVAREIEQNADKEPIAYMRAAQFIEEAYRQAGGASLSHMPFNGRINKIIADGLARSSSAAAHAVDDFKLSLSQVLDRTLRLNYGEVGQTYEPWTTSGTLPDFRAVERIMSGVMPNWKDTPELAEIGEETFGETGESIKAKLISTGLSVSIQAIINDTLGLFAQRAALFAQSAARTKNERVWEYVALTAKIMQEDDEPLFSANHRSGSNYLNGAPPTLDNQADFEAYPAFISTVRQMMVKQQNYRKENQQRSRSRIGVRPKYILCADSFADKLDRYLNASWVADNNYAGITPRQRAYEMISEPHLDVLADLHGAKHATNLYFAADPSMMPGIEVSTVEGFEGIQTHEVTNGGRVLGMSWMAWTAWGVAATEHRGLLLAGVR